MQRQRAPDDLPRVDDKQSIGLIGNLPRPQILQHFSDRLRFAHGHHVLCHQATDRVLVVIPRVLQPGTVLGRQRLRHLLDHVVRNRA